MIASVEAQGLEGLVAKKRTSVYDKRIEISVTRRVATNHKFLSLVERGQRSGSWQKTRVMSSARSGGVKPLRVRPA
jgi:hypothetical protein